MNVRIFIRSTVIGLITGMSMIQISWAGCLNLMGYDLENPAPEAIKFVKLITDTIGVQHAFEIRAVDFGDRTPVAFTTLCNGKSYIVYDKINYMWFETNRIDFATAGVLVHEMAHNFSGDLGGIKRKDWDQELTADYLAGFVLAKLGSTEKEATAFTRFLSKGGSKTHPPRSMRVKAIKEGWQKSRITMRWEQTRCIQSEWIGEPFELDYNTYRQLRLCRAGLSEYRLTQKVSDDEWDLLPLSKTE